MNAAWGAINAAAAGWGQGMLRASWQGGLALLLALGLSQAVFRRSGRAQSWLWRLAYLKSPAALLLLVPLSLPLLSAARDSAPRPVPARPMTITADVASAPSGPSDLVIPAAADSTAAAVQVHLTGQAWLLLLWIAGLGGCVIHLLVAWRRTRELRGAAVPVGDPAILAACAELCEKIGLRTAPQVLASESPLAPFLTGIFRPAIILPAALAAAPAERLSLILAHELAHQKRGDLLWNLFHYAVGALFFFHPLVWLARRQARLAQELATDELTLTITRAPVAAYGRTLLDVLALQNHLRRAPMSVGVADSPGHMRRRLLAMKTFSPWTRRRLMGAGILLAFAGTLGILPWRVVAQSAPPPATVPAAADTAPAISGGPAAESPSFDSASVRAPTADIVAPFSAAVTEILVKPGQRVKKGDILFKLDNRDAMSRIVVDEARVEIAQSKIKAAQHQQSQEAIGAVSAADAAAALDQANAELKVEQALLESDQIAADSANIRAPIDGTLTNFDLAPGELVQKGDPLVRVVNTGDMQVVFLADPRVELKSGQKIVAHIDNGKDIAGEITYISPEMSGTSGAYEVSAKLTGDTAGVKPGMVGSVTVAK